MAARAKTGTAAANGTAAEGAAAEPGSAPHRTASIEAVTEGLRAAGYVANRQTATAVFLSERLQKPILVEGPAGVGKTELAKATADLLGLPLIRMQCHEGIDESRALYEWKYGKQLLYTQILKDQLSRSFADAPDLPAALERLHDFGDVFFSERFLEPRPLLRALQQPAGCVLLVDEVDKSDQEFEAFLLELLSEYQVSIAELGPIRATVPPVVILTSNNLRDLGDALKRRCLHLYIGYPDQKLEERIVDIRLPGMDARLRRHLVTFVQALRTLDLKKAPSISETIDWARVLMLLHATELDQQMVRDTLNVLLKFEVDIETAERQLAALISKAVRDPTVVVNPAS